MQEQWDDQGSLGRTGWWLESNAVALLRYNANKIQVGENGQLDSKQQQQQQQQQQ